MAPPIDTNLFPDSAGTPRRVNKRTIGVGVTSPCKEGRDLKSPSRPAVTILHQFPFVHLPCHDEFNGDGVYSGRD
jgi:hypothetical protein